MTELATKSSITLKGSAQMIQQFFHYGIHSILYQRGIYPSDSFTRFAMNLKKNKKNQRKKVRNDFVGQQRPKSAQISSAFAGTC